MNTRLFVAWRAGDENNGRWRPVGWLEHDGQAYRFGYTRGAESPSFRPFTGMPRLNVVYESKTLFPLFANRLLPASRPEYKAYLTWGGFDPAVPPDPLQILAVTEGIRQTDSLELFPRPMPDGDGCFLSKFFLHGVRHGHAAAIERVNQLRPGDRLAPMLDACNRFDAGAVALRTDEIAARLLIGYVPRYLAKDIGKLLQDCHPENIVVSVEKLNFDAPLQQRVLCKLTACWPDGFRPCAGDEFRPIAESAAVASS